MLLIADQCLKIYEKRRNEIFSTIAVRKGFAAIYFTEYKLKGIRR